MPSGFVTRPTETGLRSASVVERAPRRRSGGDPDRGGSRLDQSYCQSALSIRRGETAGSLALHRLSSRV